MITANNNFVFGLFSTTSAKPLHQTYKTMETFFFRIVNNIITFSEAELDAKSKRAVDVGDMVDTYLSLQNLKQFIW